MPIFIPGIFAFLFVIAVTPTVRLFSIKIEAVDIPLDNRRMHKTAVPTAGGISILLGMLLSSAIFSSWDFQTIQLLIIALAISIVGVLDDIYALKPLIKLILQLAVAASSVNLVQSTIFPPIITIAWIVLIMNAMNLIDGIDGLCCGISFILAITIAIVSHSFYAAVLAGACIGFLYFNKEPSRFFLGDCGSLLLGYLLAVLSLDAFGGGNDIILLPVLFALPVADLVFVFIKRIVSGKNPFLPDKSHIHHRLIGMGLSVRQSVSFLWTFTAFCAIVTVIAYFGARREAICTAAVGYALFLLNFYNLRNIRTKDNMGIK